MNTNPIQLTQSLFAPLALALACAAIVAATLAGRPLPLINGPRGALLALLILGMAACTGGIGQVGASGRWLAPLAIAGYVLGAAILAVIVSALAGWKLPWVANETQAVLAVAGLMAVKYSIGIAGYFFHWL
jgi:hypothetical protein